MTVPDSGNADGETLDDSSTLAAASKIWTPFANDAALPWLIQVTMSFPMRSEIPSTSARGTARETASPRFKYIPRTAATADGSLVVPSVNINPCFHRRVSMHSKQSEIISSHRTYLMKAMTSYNRVRDDVIQ